jgi:uncharacterized membrane protein
VSADTGCLIVLTVGAAIVLAIRALVLAKRASDAARLQAELYSDFSERIGRLEQRLLDLKRALRTGVTVSGAPEAKEPVAAAAPAAAQPPPSSPPPSLAPPPGPPATPPPTTPAFSPPPAPPPTPAPAVETAPTPVASGAAAQPPPPPSPPRLKPAFDWEGLVGVKLFSWIAGVALVIGAIFFLRYSIDRGWLSSTVRMTLGVLTGLVLLVLCELKAARRYPVTANALDAAAIAILFSTFFASHARWHLLVLPAVFGLMALVTAVAVLLSVRRDSLFIALLGLVGGFATPALLSTGEDRPIGLFGYLLLLNAGLAWVAYRKRWPHLTALSLVLTVFYQWAWVLKFLDPPRMPLAMAIFLVFPLLGVAAYATGVPIGTHGDRTFGLTVAVGSALPLAFAVFLAGTPAFGAQFLLLFGFLFLVVAGLEVIAIARGPAELHLAGEGMTLVVFAVWFAVSYRSAAWPPILAMLALFVALFLAVDLLARRVGRGEVEFLRPGAAAPYVLFGFPVLAAIEPAAASPGLLFGALFALLAGLALYAVAFERGPMYYPAAFFALAAEAVWSSRHLTPARLLPALLIYTGFALFYLGVPMLARSRGRALRPNGGDSVLLFASLALLFFLAGGPAAPSALWGVGLLLVILNLGLFAEGSAGRFPALAVGGVLLSWIILALWWASAPVESLLVPALVVVAGVAMIAAGGSVWAGRRAEDVPGNAAALFGGGIYLSLAGHVFLFFVASQEALAVPPWPMLGVLAVLDIALAAAAFAAARGELLIAALAASQAILTVFVLEAGSEPWPLVGLASSAVVAVLGLAFFAAVRRSGRGELRERFAAAAATAAFLAEAIPLAAVGLPGPPSWPLLAAGQVVVLAALFLVAAALEWHLLAALAVAPAFAVVYLWSNARFRPEAWTQELFFAAIVFAVFLVYPLALGRRARAFRQPYLAAALASAPFFFLARHALVVGGWRPRIGLLPVVEAALMLGLLARLLALEPAGRRSVPRLAIVAGAALAFVTVAIPLQLEKQWITIGFALEAAALSWLYARLKHAGLLFWTAGLSAVVFVRLALNNAVLSYYPRQGPPILNWYLYTYVTSAAALFLAVRFLRPTDDRLAAGTPRLSTLLPAAATVLLFLVVNIEIADAFSSGPRIAFNFSAGLAQDLTYTLAWAIFAFGLLVAGIVRKNRAARIASLALLVVTIFKCFVHDLWRLGGLYRVGSFVGLAVCLSLVALALQKFVLARAEEKA